MMKHQINIIPTPKVCNLSKGDIFSVSKIYQDGCFGERLSTALSLLSEKGELEMSDSASADLIITTSPDDYFPDSELDIFDEKYAFEQGYILCKQGNAPTVIAAKSEMGCVYGIMTLIQLIGHPISDIFIKDAPDFKLRGNMWTIWAETCIWSFDFGDGAEAICARIKRLLDLNLKYKINAIYMDGFGLNLDRFPEYADIMRYANDEARKRGMNLYTGCYGMSYGCAGYGNFYQGKDYLNRKSYPDGEIYDCIGSYLAYDMKTMDWVTGWVDRENRSTVVPARHHGTCMSNDALFEIKAAEFEKYVLKTHCTGLYMHNMDAYEIHPELWMARCEDCRRKWPSDDLFAKDGAAGAFAWYFDKLAHRLSRIKDGNFDASKHLNIFLISPGYCYPVVTNDEDFERAVRFWEAVSQYMDNDIISIGFREQFFYHDKNVPRGEFIKNCNFKNDVYVINFSGADGFYDDKIFTVSSVFNYIMKDYDGIVCANGNALQEPLQLFNAEYLWSSEGSAFFNIENRPENQKEFVSLYNSAIASRFRPDEIYRDGGFLDIICTELYGEATGKKMSAVYKLCGKGGEPPVLCASSVDIYTECSVCVYPMRWDNEEITADKIAEMTDRFKECAAVSQKAYIALCDIVENDNVHADIVHLKQCFETGSRLCSLLYEYMLIYTELDACFAGAASIPCDMTARIDTLRDKIDGYIKWSDSICVIPLDKFGGTSFRRREMGEMLEYWTSIMISSIKSGKRIPDDRKELPKKEWW